MYVVQDTEAGAEEFWLTNTYCSEDEGDEPDRILRWVRADKKTVVTFRPRANGEG